MNWYPIEGETRRFGSGMVEFALGVGRDEVVYVITHESVKEQAIDAIKKALAEPEKNT